MSLAGLRGPRSHCYATSARPLWPEFPCVLMFMATSLLLPELQSSDPILVVCAIAAFSCPPCVSTFTSVVFHHIGIILGLWIELFVSLPSSLSSLLCLNPFEPVLRPRHSSLLEARKPKLAKTRSPETRVDEGPAVHHLAELALSELRDAENPVAALAFHTFTGRSASSARGLGVGALYGSRFRQDFSPAEASGRWLRMSA